MRPGESCGKPSCLVLVLFFVGTSATQWDLASFALSSLTSCRFASHAGLLVAVVHGLPPPCVSFGSLCGFSTSLLSGKAKASLASQSKWFEHWCGSRWFGGFQSISQEPDSSLGRGGATNGKQKKQQWFSTSFFVWKTPFEDLIKAGCQPIQAQNGEPFVVSLVEPPPPPPRKKYRRRVQFPQAQPGGTRKGNSEPTAFPAGSLCTLLTPAFLRGLTS